MINIAISYIIPIVSIVISIIGIGINIRNIYIIKKTTAEIKTMTREYTKIPHPTENSGVITGINHGKIFNS